MNENKVEQDERDAARYRWLRDQMRFVDDPSGVFMELREYIKTEHHNVRTDWQEHLWDASVDATIDAAMGAQIPAAAPASAEPAQQITMQKVHIASVPGGESESVDTPEFREMLYSWCRSEDGLKALAGIVAHIDAHTARAVQEAQQPQWISVDERLPDDDCRVLAATWFTMTHDQHLDIVSFRRGSGQFSHSDVTHWMLLPSAPQEPASTGKGAK